MNGSSTLTSDNGEVDKDFRKSCRTNQKYK